MDRDNRKNRTARILSGFLKHSFLIFLSVAALYPVYFMIINSFKTPIQYAIDRFSVPGVFTIVNYWKVLFESNLLIWLKNSFIVTALSILICTSFGCLAAFSFSKLKMKGKELIFNSLIGLMMFPSIILLIPLFVLMSKLGMLNSYIGAILVYVGIMIPFTIYMLTNFFRTIPDDIVDAAYIDGCSDFQIFRVIVLPLAKPAIAAVVVINSLWVWNEFLIALTFLQQSRLKTIQVGMTIFQSQYTMNIPAMLAGTVIASIPIFGFYVFTQRYLIRGIVAGAIKG